jgi:ABC-type Fe3+ transport system permease subunit
MSPKVQTQSPPPPQAPQQQQAQIQPQYAQAPPPYMPPPQQRSTSNIILIVVVIIIIIVIIVPIILAAVLYFLVSGMVTNGTTEPNVNLQSGTPTGTAGEWQVTVAAATSSEPLDYFKVAVLNGSATAISVKNLQSVKSTVPLAVD